MKRSTYALMLIRLTLSSSIVSWVRLNVTARLTIFGTVPSGGNLAEGLDLGLKLRAPITMPALAELADLGDKTIDFAHSPHLRIRMY